MQREIIEKANEIINIIDDNKKSVDELQKYVESGKVLFTRHGVCDSWDSPVSISFEDWEIRLIIHNKKQRIAALEKQLEKL